MINYGDSTVASKFVLRGKERGAVNRWFASHGGFVVSGPALTALLTYLHTQLGRCHEKLKALMSTQVVELTPEEIFEFMTSSVEVAVLPVIAKRIADRRADREARHSAAIAAPSAEQQWYKGGTGCYKCGGALDSLEKELQHIKQGCLHLCIHSRRVCFWRIQVAVVETWRSQMLGESILAPKQKKLKKVTKEVSGLKKTAKELEKTNTDSMKQKADQYKASEDQVHTQLVEEIGMRIAAKTKMQLYNAGCRLLKHVYQNHHNKSELIIYRLMMQWAESAVGDIYCLR